MRERLWPVIARRATAAVYRRSRRAALARGRAGALVDADGPLPTPRLEDQIALSLADRLPGPAVALLGVRGLRLAGRCVGLPLRALGRLTGLGRSRTGAAR